MATPVLMPRQGQSVETCIMGQWHKNVGDKINHGDILFSYETDKASFDEEAKADGILLARFFDEGDEVPVLVNVAVIGKAGESTDEFKPGASAEVKSEAPEAEEARVIEFAVETMPEEHGRIRISPLARNMAEDLGINFHNIEGTGPHGRIIARDIEKAKKTEKIQEPVIETREVQRIVEAPSIPAAVSASANQIYGEDFEIKSIPNIRKLIAKAMYQSLHNSPSLLIISAPMPGKSFHCGKNSRRSSKKEKSARISP
jgi:pyruvate dehydrogenase E2 component (dihydrolipoamide acetyltransferase)